MSTKQNQKKLLILGANQETVPLIKTAQEMGVFTIVTDNNPTAYAKGFADKSYDIDGMDIAGLVSLAKNEEIDGVLVGVADRLISSYQLVCDILDLPSYASKEQCKVLTDKEHFNLVCKKFDIPTIPSYQVHKTSDVSTHPFEFPIMVKPVDGNSGKGMTICRSSAEVNRAILKAKNASKRRRYLIEKYMECEDMFIYYTIIDGEILVSAIADRFTTNDQGDSGKVCIGALYPSKYSKLYFDQLHSKMLVLFEDLKLKNGILMISAFVENENIYLYDPGFRLQGEAPNIPVEAICGYDHKEMLVNFALDGQMGSVKLNDLMDYSFNNKFASTLWLLVKCGTIDQITGLDIAKLDPNVISIVQRLFTGDEIKEENIGTEGQVLARVYIVADTMPLLLSVIDKYERLIRVVDDSGQDLLLPTLSSSKLMINKK